MTEPVAFKYFLHHSLDLDIVCKISSFCLPAPDFDLENDFGLQSGGSDSKNYSIESQSDIIKKVISEEELIVTAQICSLGEPLHAVPLCSHTPAHYDRLVNSIKWEDMLIFPVKYRDLSRDAQLMVMVWRVGGLPLGGTQMSLFDPDGNLAQGLQKLSFKWLSGSSPNQLNTSMQYDPCSASVHHFINFSDVFDKNRTHYSRFAEEDNRFLLSKGLERHAKGEMPHIDWLDEISLERAHQLIRGAEDEYEGSWSPTKKVPPRELRLPPPYCSILEREMRALAFIELELPTFAHAVIHEDRIYDLGLQGGQLGSSLGYLPIPNPATTASLDETTLNALGGSAYLIVSDWETEEDNPVEGKYRKMAHDLLRGLVDTELKPNREEKERLDALIKSPALGDHLKMEEKDLLWKFRYCLTDSKKAVTKFLLSVDWSLEQEVSQVQGLLAQWQQRAPIDVSDALKLLGREKAFQSEMVRRFAVEALRSASDDELLAYMLQLVQALRYEPSRPIIPSESRIAPNGGSRNGSQVGETDLRLTPLASFLVERACGSLHLASFLFWYLKVELEDSSHGAVFRNVFTEFIRAMQGGSKQSAHIIAMLQAQEGYIGRVADAQRAARDEKGRKEAKEAKLNQLLNDPELVSVSKFLHQKGSTATSIPMPLDPAVQVTGLNPTTAFIFRSALYPCVVEFVKAVPEGEVVSEPQAEESDKEPALTVSNYDKSYKVIFKSGDDLRQDQLIIQMISLMDGLLKRVNLDLKLMPYRILATGPKDGLVEFVARSQPVSAVLSGYGNSILEFLKHHNPDPNGPMGIQKEAVLTFVKSCAGYCVITYILGIGDRHLDNLMLLPHGNLFHIDFGYIFGLDPKPMAPPFRFTREMADAMGGIDSEYYGRFKTYCCQAYTWLRKSAHLILNLLNLMVDAGIDSLSTDPVAVLGRVADRFRLDLNDEQADHFFLSLIDESLFAFAPRVMEVMHKMAVARR